MDYLPDPAEADNRAGIQLARQRRTAEALALFDRAAAMPVDYAEAYNMRADILLAAQRPLDALGEARKALECRPDSVQAQNNLGLALLMTNRFHEARPAFERLLLLDSDHPTAHRSLGIALQSCGQYTAAIKQFEQALASRRDDADAWSRLGTAFFETGRREDARRAFEHAVAAAPRTPLYYRQLGTCRRFEADDGYVAAMENLLATPTRLNPVDQIELHFAVGKAYADLARHEDSFRHLLAGNALSRRQVTYDETATLAVFDRIREICSPAVMREKACGGDPSSLPVFILGMPRSGSTLVEQILASHPQVFGAGELQEFENALVRASGPAGSPRKFIEALPRMPDSVLRQVGAAYVAALSALAPDAARVTDKMPPHYLFVGPIHLALPNARIIHTRRDPVDTCLSCFSKLFAGHMPHTFDLGELGRYYNAYAGLMAHWRQVLPPGVMLEIDYEDVVGDPETAARRIVAHCGLDWHPACLDFHLTERPVRTASATAVREKVYRDAVGRWRPYATMLGPLLEALGVS